MYQGISWILRPSHHHLRYSFRFNSTRHSANWMFNLLLPLPQQQQIGKVCVCDKKIKYQDGYVWLNEMERIRAAAAHETGLSSSTSSSVVVVGLQKDASVPVPVPHRLLFLCQNYNFECQSPPRMFQCFLLTKNLPVINCFQLLRKRLTMTSRVPEFL